jgi:hypothetical protein
MAVISIKNKTKSGSLLVGNEPFELGEYRSIQTVTVGAGGATVVTFSNIPSTYQHLQLRCFLNNAGGNISTSMQFNGDTGTNYAKHLVYGDGASDASSGVDTTASMTFQMYSGNAANNYSATVMDILDYTNTNKNTTVRGFCGWDNNGSGSVLLGSGLWMNTAAVSTIRFGVAGSNWSQYSSFALYGIKG